MSRDATVHQFPSIDERPQRHGYGNNRTQCYTSALKRGRCIQFEKKSFLLFDFVPATVPGCVGQKFAKEFKVLTGTYKTELFHRTVCHDRGRLKRPIQPTQLQHRDRDTQSEPEYRPIFTISSLWNQKET